jgi:hypothetical protein
MLARLTLGPLVVFTTTVTIWGLVLDFNFLAYKTHTLVAVFSLFFLPLLLAVVPFWALLSDGISLLLILNFSSVLMFALLVFLIRHLTEVKAARK